MSRSCLYCEHARVTLPALRSLAGRDVVCTARNEVLETKLRILSKATEWLAGVRGEVLGTDDIEELCEIEREVDGR